MKIGSLNDPMNISRDMSKTGHHGNGDYVVEISNEDDIENVIPLIKQSLKVNKKQVQKQNNLQDYFAFLKKR